MESLVHDLRFAIRQLRKMPGMATLAILTLALGIGANTAMFTVIESVLLRPLPYAHAKRLMYIGPAADQPVFGSTSWLDYRDIREESRTLSDVAGYSSDVSVVELRDASESVSAPRITPNLIPMLGVKPLLGRTFTQAEGQPGGPQVVLLSEQLWKSDFHGDPDVLGRLIKVGGIDRAIVGVMPAAFSFPNEGGPDVQKGIWLPLQPTPEMLKDRGYDFFNIVGQLRPGATVQAAQQELDTIAGRIRRKDPKDAQGLEFSVTPYEQLLTWHVRPVFYALLAALALVLLISCANVANLLIARCLGRRQEFAVRAALGADRSRLIRQMMTEGLLLSVAGAGCGLALAQAILAGVHKLPAGTIPRAASISIDWTVVLALAAIAALATVLSSLIPAVLAGRTAPQTALQAATRGTGSRSVSGRLSAWLVTGEVALSVVLLIGTGLLFRTLWNLENADLGFAATHVTTFTAMPADAAGFSSLGVTQTGAAAPVSLSTLVYRPALDRIRSLPGVDSAALATAPPLAGVDLHSSFTVVGQPKDQSRNNNTRVSAISGDYARTLRTPVVMGRMISGDDSASSPFVAVVNQAFAKRYFADRNPLGQKIDLGGKDTGMIEPYTITGVLADQAGNTVGGSVGPLLLLPMAQIPPNSLFYPALLKTVVGFVVRTRGNIPIAGEMRSVFHQVAPQFALDNFQTMRETVEQHTFDRRLGLYLIGSFAGLAVLMVVAGLYGVLSQLVGYRRREIGIRIALGASRKSVLRMVLRQGSVLVAIGAGVGLALALATGRLLTGFLYHVRAADPRTYAAVIIVLFMTGFLAALVPARRAAGIEPMQALRED